MGLNYLHKPIEQLLADDSPLLKATQEPPIKILKFKGLLHKRTVAPQSKIIYAPKSGKDKE
jgi:hypothetical protein